jgi:hypothetical protein
LWNDERRSLLLEESELLAKNLDGFHKSVFKNLPTILKERGTTY